MIAFTSRVDKITNEIHRQVSQGKLRPGDRLPAERNLCVTFGVGRTTIREALKSLHVRGVIGRRGRGTVILDPQNVMPAGLDLPSLAAQVNIKQLYEIRKLLEVEIAGWAAQRATAKEIKAIRRALAGEWHPAEGSPHRAFHTALAKAAHNPALVQIYESGSQIFFRLPFFWKLFDDSEIKTVRARRHELARRWHEHILRAIEQRDIAEARGAMFQHLDIMEKDLLARLHRRDPKGTQPNSYFHPMLAELESADQDNPERKRASR